MFQAFNGTQLFWYLFGTILFINPNARTNFLFAENQHTSLTEQKQMDWRTKMIHVYA